jgi:hypothetical protein
MICGASLPPPTSGENAPVIHALQPSLEQLRARMDEKSFAEAWQRGRALKLADAAREALQIADVT